MKNTLDPGLSTLSKTAIILFSTALLIGMGAAAAGHDFSNYKHSSEDTAVSSNLQSAIDSASDNDVLLVENGEYSSVTIDKPLTLVAANQGGATIAGTVTVDSSDVTVKGFEITGGSTDLLNQGVHVSGKNSDNVIIESNYIHGVTGEERATGVKLYGQTKSEDNSISDVVVKNNRIENIKTTTSSSEDRTIKTKGIALSEDVQNAEITGNTIKDIGDSNSEMSNGIDINAGQGEDVPQNFIITNNKFTDIDHGESLGYTPTAGGIYITGYKSETGYGSSHKVSNNQFMLSETTDTADIKVWDGYGDGVINAKNNYWGTDGVDYEVQDTMYTPESESTPGTTEVQYSPYYTDAEMTTLKVDQSGSIQDAIDEASSGDTVKVAEGTYRESVEITTENVTLTSTSDEVRARVVYAPEDRDGTATIAVRSDNATIDGLEVVRRSGNGESNPITQGIRISGSEVEIINNKVLAEDFSDLENVGIMVVDGDSEGPNPKDVKNVDVNSNTVENFGSGFSIGVGYGKTVEDLNVVDNQFNSNNFGISIGAKNDQTSFSPQDVSFVGNELNDNEYGVIVFGEKTEHKGGGFVNFDSSDIEIRDTEFGDNNQAELVNDNNQEIDATRNYWGEPTGPEDSQVSGDVDWRPYYPTEQAFENSNSHESYHSFLGSFDTVEPNTERTDEEIIETIDGNEQIKSFIQGVAQEEDTTLTEDEVIDFAEQVDTTRSNSEIESIAESVDSTRSNSAIRSIAENVASNVSTVSEDEVANIVQSETEGFVTEEELDERVETIESQEETIEAQEERINELEAEVEQINSRMNETLEAIEDEEQPGNRGTGAFGSSAPGNSEGQGGIGGFFSGLFG